MMHFSGLLPSVRARNELHRATMRLIYQGARAPAASRVPRRPVLVAAKDKGRRRYAVPKLDAVKLITYTCPQNSGGGGGVCPGNLGTEDRMPSINSFLRRNLDDIKRSEADK